MENERKLVIGFVYNVKRNQPSVLLTRQNDIEFDSPKVIEAIKIAIEKNGFGVIMLEADEEIYEKLKAFRHQIDLVFNIAEGVQGDARESQVPLFCEMLGIPYTHSSPTTNAVALNKQLTKKVVSGIGVKVPGSVVTKNLSYDVDALNFPLIVKPNKEGSSKGVLNKSVVRSTNELNEMVSALTLELNEEVILEEFVDGREFTVSLLKVGGIWQVLPIVEQRFDFLPPGFNKIASFELKWLYEDSLENPSDAYVCPAEISGALQKQIEESSVAICDLLEIRGCARIDYRLNENNELYFIEINPLPGLNPDEKVISYFPLSSRVVGFSFEEVIGHIIEDARNTWGI